MDATLQNTSNLITETNTNANKLPQINYWGYFICLCLVLALIMVIEKTIIVSDTLYFEALSETVAYERIQEMLSFQKEWVWLGYVMIPVVVTLKVFLISICLLTGFVLNRQKVSFKHTFQMVLLLEAVWLVPALIKTTYFLIAKDYTLQSLNSFYPHSLLALFDAKNLNLVLVYPIYTLNLVELVYILLLGVGVQRLTNQVYTDSLKDVLSTYFVGLLVWVLCVCFLMVSLAP